jgi:hypothetical protein
MTTQGRKGWSSVHIIDIWLQRVAEDRERWRGEAYVAVDWGG